MTNNHISIHLTTVEAIPELATINARAYHRDPFFRTAWSSVDDMIPFYVKRLNARFATPGTMVWMAKDRYGVPVGFVALTLVEAKSTTAPTEQQSVSQAALKSGFPAGLDMDMVRNVQAAVTPMMGQMWEKHYCRLRHLFCRTRRRRYACAG